MIRGLLILMVSTSTVAAAPVYIDRLDHISVARDHGGIYFHEHYPAYVKLHGDIEKGTFVLERFEAEGFSLPPLTLDLLHDANPLITSKHAWAHVGDWDYLFELYPHNLVRILARDPSTGRGTYVPIDGSEAKFSYYWGMADNVVPEPSGLLLLLIGTLCMRRIK